MNKNVMSYCPNATQHIGVDIRALPEQLCNCCDPHNATVAILTANVVSSGKGRHDHQGVGSNQEL